MQLTQQQYDIINSRGNIKINAVAGSGKTTTLIEYAKTRPANSRILYLAFNKSVKLEAVKRFREIGLSNVQVETAHSLAYKHIVFRYGYRIKSTGYKSYEVAEILQIKDTKERHFKYIVANHINKLVAYFCNSSQTKVKDINYLDIVTEPKAKIFVENYYPYIVRQSRIFLGKMDKKQIEISHDFYLKKFQLSNPVLRYDYILFDEGQDASPTMLDVFLKQKATKLIVGDAHQQIYGWRHAVNSLEKVDFKNYPLSTSFRFSQAIADLSMEVLEWKNHLSEHEPFPIKGVGKNHHTQTKAVLARTNLGLLLNAIEQVKEKHDLQHLYFEGNINSYTYASEGASLYDVLNLYNGKRQYIRNTMIKQMRDFGDLEEYVKKTEDVELGLMMEIVLEYGNEIPDILEDIKLKHVDNNEKEKAQTIFSTVHRCKGLEYDVVHLVNDFINEEMVLKNKLEVDLNPALLPKFKEEINLLYVAITRTRNLLFIPEDLMPIPFPPAPQIQILKTQLDDTEGFDGKHLTKSSLVKEKIPKKVEEKEKAYTYDEVRKEHHSAYQPWTQELDDELTILYCEGIQVNELAKHFGRTKGAIKSRIERLDLEDIYDL